MRIKSLLFIFLFMSANSMFAQYQENLPQAKPIPPNAASLFKTLEKPLGTFTGTIPISFPLFSVSSGSLSASVSLDYNSTGGIKVEELGGPVGLGFSLNDGGGRITQIVRDKPDDDLSYGRLYNGLGIQASNFDCDDNDHLYYFQQGYLDLEPDIFVYSFPGHSGKFFFKEDGSLVLMTNDNIKIAFEYYYWQITDAAGNKYRFDNAIQNSSTWSGNYGSSPSSMSSQSWFLTEVTDMNYLNTLTYTYTNTGSLFTTYSGSYLPLGTALLNCQGFNTTGDMGIVTTDGGEMLVTRIDGKDGYILFNTDAPYLYAPLRVTSIELHDPSNNLKKKYKLNYGTSFSSNRQKLINFSEFGSSGTDSLTTKFEYEEFYNLPTVLSTSCDLWGYYNGAGNDYTLMIPKISVAGGWWPAYWDYYYADRSAGGLIASANILKKVSYPSGGSREIVYEGNRALGWGNFFQYSPDNEFMTTRTFSETDFTLMGSYFPSMQHLFAVNSFYGQTRFNWALHDIGFSCDITVKIMALMDSTDESGTEVHAFHGGSSGNWILPNGIYRLEVYADDPYSSCTVGEVSASWPEGTYQDTTITTGVYGIAYSSFYKRAYRAPGVRVKEVKDYDPVSNKTYKTEYRYKYYSADSTVEAGMFISPVNIMASENVSECGCQYTKVFSGSSYPLSAESGSYVVYPEVRTIDSANGWTDRSFSYSYDYPATTYPYGPPTDNSYGRGKLAQEKIYNNSGSLLKKSNYSWGILGGSQYATGKKVKRYWYLTVGGQPYLAHWTDVDPGYDSYPYDVSNEMSYCTDYTITMPLTWLSASVDSIYGSGGSQVIKTEYSNYLQDGQLIPSRKTVSINSGVKKEQTYKYAFNSNSDFKLGLNAAEQYMKTSLNDKHYYLPLEVVDSLRPASGGLTFLEGAKYIFEKKAPIYWADSIINLKTYRSYTTASDSTEINFSAYDSSGNLRERYLTNNIKEVTIWGYDRTYPVVKVTGSDLSTVLGFINLSIINSPSSDAALRTELNKIRTGLAGSMAQVTTYTYSPLYGMTSVTDPSGKITYYEYDLFGRLKLVRDKDGRILKKNEYKMNNPL